jgi:NADP-dependent 3-hydroxy acid dehydrogenase YdfG
MSVLSDRVAIVTGASSGIGEATAIALARRNARVVLAARRDERLRELAKRIVAEGGHALATPCDVTDLESVRSTARTTLRTFGRIDILINNAGVMPLAPMASCRFEDWDRAIDVNLRGALYCIGAVLPAMLEAGSGHIVNISSVAGRRVFPNAAVYCATKFGLHALSESLRGELADRARTDGNRVRVSIIAPGAVRTELDQSILDAQTRAETIAFYDSIKPPLEAAEIARAILTVLESPSHVSFDEVVIRPTAQIR